MNELNNNPENMEDETQPDTNKPEDEKVIRLTFSLTRSDLFWYNLHFIRLLGYAAVAFFILSIVFFVIALNTPYGDLRTTFIWVVMASGAGFSITAGSIAAIVLQVFILKNDTITRAMTRRSYIISESGVAVYNEQGRIKRTWKEIRKVVKTHHGFYMKTGEKIAIVLPRHVFKDNNQIKLLEGLIRANAVSH